MRLRVTAVLLCVFLLSACGREPTLEERNEFSSYFERFEEASRQVGRDTYWRPPVRIVFGI